MIGSAVARHRTLVENIGPDGERSRHVRMLERHAYRVAVQHMEESRRDVPFQYVGGVPHCSGLWRGGENSSELPACARDQRPDRPFGNRQRTGNVCVRQAIEMVERERHAIPCWHPIQSIEDSFGELCFFEPLER